MVWEWNRHNIKVITKTIKLWLLARILSKLGITGWLKCSKLSTHFHYPQQLESDVILHVRHRRHCFANEAWRSVERTFSERLVQRKWSVRKIEAKEEDSPTFITIMSLPLPVLWFYFQFGLTVFQGHILALP